MKNISCLRCSKCRFELSAASPQTVCPKDAGALYAIYDLKSIKKNFNRESLAGREKSLWRYREVLPDVAPVSLGEGFTPMLPSRREKNVFIKDEGLNPTDSFKALSEHEKDCLIEFLKTLQVLPPGTESSIVDEKFQPRSWVGHLQG